MYYILYPRKPHSMTNVLEAQALGTEKGKTFFECVKDTFVFNEVESYRAVIQEQVTKQKALRENIPAACYETSSLYRHFCFDVAYFEAILDGLSKPHIIEGPIRDPSRVYTVTEDEWSLCNDKKRKFEPSSDSDGDELVLPGTPIDDE